MSPEDYNALKAFRDLIAKTIDDLSNATTQGGLARIVADCATGWDDVDKDFANVLRDIGQSVWTRGFATVAPTVKTIADHLGRQLKEVEGQLR